MAFQTPQRPLPGAYIPTPAVTRYQPASSRPPPFPRTNSSLAKAQTASQPPKQIARQPSEQPRQASAKPTTGILNPVERASKTINETLELESKYPELDTYVGQGISSEYDTSNSPAWAPFDKVKSYPIPDKIFAQYNRAQISTLMGLFADLNYAWVAIDNACYLWDYTHPNPELVGFEDQPNSITGVRLVTPRAGVFVPTITRLLVIATTVEVILVGLSSTILPTGGRSVTLYKTGMSIPVRGMGVNIIEGSAATGRVFFAGRSDNDVYELTYSQEEKWYQNRCGKINHINNAFTALAPAFSFRQKPQQEHIVQMIIDDSRQLLYTLSSTSTIRTFHMKAPQALTLVITKRLTDTLNNIGHMTSQSELITPDIKIVSISPVASREASKIHIIATTSTGCRIFMSATSAYGYSITNSSDAPSTMQVQHVKFPPAEVSGPKPPPQQPSTQLAPYTNNRSINTSSKTLKPTRTATRYSPGFFFCFVSQDPQGHTDKLFISAPDAGRIARPQENSSLSRYAELGLWVNLGSRAEDVGLISPYFSATSSPMGFANELTVQYDKTAAEVAILTNTGIHTFRRRRLVDMFAAVIKLGGGEEGLEGEMKSFVRTYGRGETTAAALAVACGQGLDVTSDSRLAKITDPEVLDFARKAFIEYGGKPMFNENSLIDQSLAAIDMARPSPRHEGLALYVTRLIRSFWRLPIALESVSPIGGLTVKPTVTLAKIKDVQEDLTELQNFLTKNRSFIEGLAGPEALRQVSTKQEEIALQAEHRALHSLVVLVSNMIEGISFVLVLFDERIEEIILSLTNEIRQQVRNLTYERLFCSLDGRELAKELVKAIVNRNIANGSSVDTVAEALRRRCGSFCSAEDVVIFKAQEQLKRATEAGVSSEFGRNLLNESLRLFKQVAANLSTEQLQWAVYQYVSMQFFAGAIQLALCVAQEMDRGNRALSWIQEGRPEQDPRALVFGNRKNCYNLIHEVIGSVDKSVSQDPDIVDGNYTLAAKRRSEAWDVIDTSDDEVFQTDLYDWYIAQGQAERLLSINSPYIITYLQRKSVTDIAHADLLWRYYNQANLSHEAAAVQLALAKSAFMLSLDRRIEYLSRAKTNASAQRPGIGRQQRQLLLRESSDLLDVANIQDDILQRLKGDARVTADRRPGLIQELDGPILDLSTLYNRYADQAGYFDLCILMYQISDERNPAGIRTTWQNYLDGIHEATVTAGAPQPYEAVAEGVRSLGSRLGLSGSTFPVEDLIPMLERYAFEHQRGVGPPTWVVDIFLDLQVPYESIFSALENMFYNDDMPFRGRNKRYVADNTLYITQRWFQESSRGGERKLFGGEANVSGIQETLGMLMQNGLEPGKQAECGELIRRISYMLT